MVNLAFNRFGVGTFSMELVLSNSCRWLITLPGLVFNSALLYTIISEKNLRGTCATLLAIGSVVDFLFLLSFSVPFALSWFGQNMISNFGCFFLQFLPNFGVFSSVWIVFFVGVDRLISVLLPLRYGLFEQHLFIYILPMLTVTFGYSISVLVEAAKWALFVYPDWPVLCTNSDMFSFGMTTMLLRNGLIINGVSIICYLFVGLSLFRSWQKNPSSVIKHRIFKSLASIMTFLAGTYFATCFISLLLASVTDPIFILHISPSITALLTVTAASSNAPILFAFSTEYRQAFRKHLKEMPFFGISLFRIGQQQQQLPNAVSMVAAFNNAIPQPSSVSRVRQTTAIGRGVPRTMAPVDS
ncbi:hypothetical protein niasHS_008360 [Heterodera schachtii]|uniref:G-protein coupled receptors family 1 profile domain-containing protein n=1 Tax=Heterodera schachtii TaxID=97005 RepID=A0ABD2JCU2_HETSC